MTATLTAPLATSLVDIVKSHLASAGYDMAVRHRKTGQLMRGGFMVQEPESGVVVVTQKSMRHGITPDMLNPAMENYADALTGKGLTFTRGTSARGFIYLIVRRLV
jgi:hypothetical protein